MHRLDGLGYRDTTIVMTGAATGMGAAAGRILGELGAKIYIVDHQEPGIACAGFYKTDLAKPEQVSATVRALGEIGPVDHVFACAGAPHVVGPLNCMLINYIGTRQLMDGIIPSMKDGGSIAIISSDAGMGWQSNLAKNLEFLAISDAVEAGKYCAAHPEFIKDGYSVSKEMLIVWSKHHGVKLAEARAIRVNCIAPCPTATPFMDPTIKDLGEEFFNAFPYPLLHRMATAEEQAWPMVLLNSRLNNVVTGALLYTDQGFAGGVMTGALTPPVTPGSARG